MFATTVTKGMKHRSREIPVKSYYINMRRSEWNSKTIDRLNKRFKGSAYTIPQDSRSDGKHQSPNTSEDSLKYPKTGKSEAEIYGNGEDRLDFRQQIKPVTDIREQVAIAPITAPYSIEAIKEKDSRNSDSTVADGNEAFHSSLKDQLERINNDESFTEFVNEIKLYVIHLLEEDLVPPHHLHIATNASSQQRAGQSTKTDKLVDFLFFHLAQNFVPHNSLTRGIKQMWMIATDTTDWFEMCCWFLDYKEIFSTFYEQLGNNKNYLFYVIKTSPDLIHNRWSHLLLRKLMVDITYPEIHDLLITTRSSNYEKPTSLFCIPDMYDNAYVVLFADYPIALNAFLTIKNNSGQTALRVNTKFVLWLLQAAYKPLYQQDYINLITGLRIDDEKANSNNSDICEENKKHLKWLLGEFEENRYVLFNCPRVTIIYSSANRSGSEDEAITIYSAFKAKFPNNTFIYEDLLTNDIIATIEESTRHTDQYDDPPSALIVVIMSHGTTGAIFDSERNPINFDEIEKTMCANSALNGRPKILITQCCQDRDPYSKSISGAHDQVIDIRQEVDPKSINNRPPYAVKSSDFCAIMSTVPGHTSQRELFIPKLAEEITNLKQNVDISKIVNNIAIKIARERILQHPIIMTTLKAELCLGNVGGLETIV